MQVPNQRKDAVEHRKRILQTAHSLFKQHGVEQVSMHQIAKSAGVGQGTLYRRYSSKGDLCFDLMNDTFQLFKTKVAVYLEQSKLLPVHERMRKLLEYCIDFMEEKSEWLGVIQSHNCEEQRARFFHSPPYLFLHSTLSELIQEEFSGNETRGPDPNYTAHAILAAMRPDLYHELRTSQGKSPEQIKRDVIALFVCTLLKPQI